MLTRHLTVGEPRNFDDGPLGQSALEALAATTEERAANARRHAEEARDEARHDAARGDHEAEKVHLREAKAHEGAARVTEQTAALYRERIRRLTDKESQGRFRTPDS